jgi:predicted dehydrogenase
MLDAESLDAVLVLTLNRSHFDLAMAAMDRGLHVLCEKPLALSAAQARAMAETAQRTGVTTMVPFTYRFMPAARYVKELLDQGFLGRPYHLDARYLFRVEDHMTRGFISAIAEGRPASPDFADGLAVQRVIEAAARSASEGRRVRIADIVADGG